MTDKDKVNFAFRTLRKHGYIAKQNYMCCGSCAWYSLGGHALAGMRDESKPEPEKVVFYHQQANEAWFNDPYGPNRRKTTELHRDLYLQWAGNGEEIMQIFLEAGLDVEWNGTPEGAICLKVHGHLLSWLTAGIGQK